MANNPKKLTDPTDEAMTAIQQVLSVSDEPTDRRTEAPVDQETPPPQQYEPAQHYEPTRSYEAPRANQYGSAPAPERDLFEDAAPAHDDVRPSQYAGHDERQSIGTNPALLAAAPVQDLLRGGDAVRARLGGLRRGARLPLSARPAGGAEARPGRHPGHDRPRRLRAGADRVLLRAGLHDVALAGDAHHRPVDGERRA